MVKINDDIWANIGCSFCNIRRSFIIKYKNNYKMINKKDHNKYKKYYIDIFDKMADLFDATISDYYNFDKIQINGVNITKIFYKYYENLDILNNNQLKYLFMSFFEIIENLNNDNNNLFIEVINYKNKHLAGLMLLLD
jgi:hypothetical protein